MAVEPNSSHNMLHKSKELLLHEDLLLMHGLLLLDHLLLALELILPSLELSKCSGGLLCLTCLVLPHTLKYGK